MRSFRFAVPTAKRVDFVDLTPFLEQAVADSGIDIGLATIVVKHTSCSLSVQEFEPNLIEDFETFLRSFVTGDPEAWHHNDLTRRPDVPPDEPLNADAHIKGLFMGNSRVVPISDGKAELGTWQRVILVEMDGPRDREVIVMIQGDERTIGRYVDDKAAVINEAIEPFLSRRFEGGMLEASRYLTRGGKRIRGTLAILVCEALGGDMDRALDAAVSVEMVHASSLIRDDIEDGDHTRRGGLSGWVVYGLRKAMAMSDILTPHAISMLKKYGREAVYVTLDAWRQLGVGQAKDLFVSTFRGGSTIYEEIAMEKTGVLFGLAATLGAIAAGADKEQKQLATRYGRRLGAAFQIMDDVADLRAGKTVPDSFRTWLGDRDPELAIKEATDEVGALASRFPGETVHKTYLAALPEYAAAAMRAEASQEAEGVPAAAEKEETSTGE